MDRRWMYDRCYDGGQVKEILKLGVELFIDAVKQNPIVRKIGGIRCPCAVCQCRRIHSEDDIKYHLERKGFQLNYLIWTSHGETFPSDQGASSSAGPMSLASQNYHGRYPFNAMNDMIGNALGFHEANEDEYEADEPPNAEAQRFYNFLKQTNEPLLIEGCTDSKLSVCIRLLGIKSNYLVAELALDQIAKLVLDTRKYQEEASTKKVDLWSKRVRMCQSCFFTLRPPWPPLSCPECVSPDSSLCGRFGRRKHLPASYFAAASGRRVQKVNFLNDWTRTRLWTGIQLGLVR
ncbi:hypothetical protein TSUD_232330 [Trifolium subterraneum]|uniref:Transposase-associated domain-containing protein n=1 Tax=Trifolium subterraneum TaxID=3900 RepID=A0A2Z6LN62_TRISU|nr:hypothetical protein TSUD_232330 [Trifolium subterraneum]